MTSLGNITMFTDNQTTPSATSNFGLNGTTAFYDVTISRVSMVMLYVVNPTLALTGLITNSLGLLVLVKDGLTRTSTVFLLSLTLADQLCLIAGIRFTALTQFYINENLTLNFTGWRYPYPWALCVYVVDVLVNILVHGGNCVSLTLPAVISVERFFAVYFPLKFKQILTVHRAIAIVVFVYILWLPWALFWPPCITFVYDSNAGYKTWSEFYINNYDTIFLFNYYIFNYLTSIFPSCITVIGAVLVGIKIQITRQNRKKISTNHSARSYRATRTLMTVSLIFAVVNLTYFVITCLLPDDQMDQKTQLAVNIFLETTTFLCSSSNFYVYIFMNPKFKKLFFGLFR